MFYSNLDLIEDYYGATGNDRKLMVLAEQLVGNRFQGVVLRDSIELDFPPTELVLSLVKAVHIAEHNIDVDTDFNKNSFDVSNKIDGKSPPPIGRTACRWRYKLCFLFVVVENTVYYLNLNKVYMSNL